MKTFRALQELGQLTHMPASDLPKDTQSVPEAGIPTTEHPCCSASQAVGTTHHHYLSLHRGKVLSLLLPAQAEQEKSLRSATCMEEFLVLLRSR